MLKRLTALMLLWIMLPVSALAAQDREALRAAWRAIEIGGTASPYAQLPTITAPYEPGELTQEALNGALQTLNFLRGLAGLHPVRDSEIYNYQCQHGAVLLAALDYVDHNAPMPADMERNFYDSAHIGTSSSNIARFNWMRHSILREGLTYFARDDGEQNLPVLGHRRWLLNPLMAATGFGLANAKSGMSYVVMYAHDLGNPEAQWDSVRWPSEGAFPAELMHGNLAWSISLNPEKYDLASSKPTITLSEAALGLSFRFAPALGTGDGYSTVNLDGYGAGGCLIFRPDFEGTGFTDYQQNQRWTVRVEHLRTWDGGEVSLSYGVEMISLYVQDAVNVEISQLAAAVYPGEILKLSAQVIPTYADDLSVTWSSTDPAVADVDANGCVTAVAPGKCDILCRDCMGHTDTCALTVSPR